MVAAMQPMHIMLFALVALAFIAAAAKILRGDRQPLEGSATDSTPPAPRFQARADGLCKHCEQPAVFPRPRIMIRRSNIESWLEFLGVNPVKRFVLVRVPVGEPELCHDHAELSYSISEQFIAETQARRAEFERQESKRLAEMATRGLDEAIAQDSAPVTAQASAFKLVSVLPALPPKINGKAHPAVPAFVPPPPPEMLDEA